MGTEGLSDDEKNALEWIKMVESEKGRVRDHDLYPKLKAWVEAAPSQNILEIGSGQGICSDRIPLAGRDYMGIDPSEILVNRANELYSSANRKFKLGSAYSLPGGDETFDAVFSVSVWHLLENLKAAAGELSRVLKPGGRFLIVTANPAAYSYWKEIYLDYEMKGKRLEGRVKHPDQSITSEVLYLHTLEEIQSSLQDSNLQIEKIDTFRVSEKTAGIGYFLSIQGFK